jgi:hypothetical protein
MGLILGKLLKRLYRIIRSNWISIFSRSEMMRFYLRIQILLHLWISFKEMLSWRVRIKLRSFKETLIYRILWMRLEKTTRLRIKKMKRFPLDISLKI